MSNSLEERLKTHSSAFDGLLSLIPAKYYYDSATQDQWQQKKQSKADTRKNKRAKLDPSSKESADDYTNAHASAKDVMDNKAKTGKPVKLPTRFVAPEPSSASDSEDSAAESAPASEPEESLTAEASLVFDDNGEEIEAQPPTKKMAQQAAKLKKKQLSPEEQKKRDDNLAKLRERLASKIDSMKEKRKAVGTKAEGAPKSRQQILEERKRKEELRKKRKREEDEVADDDSDDSDDEDEDDNEPEEEPVANNPVLFGNIVFNDGTRVTSDLANFRNTADKRKKKGPANNDLKAHLQRLEKKKERLAALPEDEQKKEMEKEKWMKVMQQAEGVKHKDDEKLLKKAIKRKEKQKMKSEREWKDRKQTVKDTIAARQKRREENLAARKDSKGVHGKKRKQLPKLKKFTGIVNAKGGPKTGPKKRAGFEGSAKSKKK
ncbi:ribosomal RNA-processing protein 14 [Diutina catenulata]